MKFLKFNILNFFIIGHFLYFVLFGLLNIFFEKQNFFTINLKSIVVLGIVFIFLLILDRSSQFKIDFDIKNRVEKINIISIFLISLFFLCIILFFYFKYNIIGSVIATPLETNYENSVRLLYGKIKGFILIPLSFFILISLYFKMKSTNKIIFLISISLMLSVLIFSYLCGRRIFAMSLILLIMAYSLDKKFEFYKLILILVPLFFIWLILSNIYLSNRSNFTLSIDSSKTDKNIVLNKLYDFESTFKNFGSRPSPFFHLNHIINTFDNKNIFFLNGKILKNSILMSIPKIIYPNKPAVLDDYILIDNLNTYNVDLSTNALTSFFVDFGYLGVIYYLFFILSLILVFNFILLKIKHNNILFLIYVCYLYCFLTHIESNISRYFITLYIGLFLVVFYFIYKIIFDEKRTVL